MCDIRINDSNIFFLDIKIIYEMSIIIAKLS